MPQTIAGQQSTAMPSPTFGAFQSGFLPDEPLLTEYRTSIQLYVEGQPGNPGTQALLETWCEITIMSTFEMAKRGLEFRLASKDGGRPDAQHIPTYIQEIAPHKKFWVASAVNQDAWWNGMTPQRLREHTIGPLMADRRLCNRLILGTALTESGWYNADQTPEPYLMNTFDSSHDHYIAYDQDGVVTPENHSYAKWHIRHHGVPEDIPIVAITNGATRCANEQEFGGFDATAEYQNLPMIQDLIKLGFTSGTPMSGVPTLFNDSIPTGYVLYIALSGMWKPMMWRVPLNPEAHSLIVKENNDIPSIEFKWFGEYVRHGWPTIVRPEMGVAMKIDAAAYSAPTDMLTIPV